MGFYIPTSNSFLCPDNGRQTQRTSQLLFLGKLLHVCTYLVKSNNSTHVVHGSIAVGDGTHHDVTVAVTYVTRTLSNKLNDLTHFTLYLTRTLLLLLSSERVGRRSRAGSGEGVALLVSRKVMHGVG
jgi:hypothetical protein